MRKADFNKKISEYDSETIKKFFDRFKINLKENKKYFDKANKIDVEITKKKIKLETLIEIVDKYQEVEFKNLNKNFIIYYKGDPYITINLFMQALLTRSKIVLAQDEFMISINEILFTIFNQTLKEFKIDNLIERCKYDKEQILEIKELINAELVSIGDTLMYQMLEEEGKFYPYYNIIMYCDNDILAPLKEAISIYCNENHYEIEMLYEEDLKVAINYINMVETSNILVLLSNNKDNIKIFKEKINKKIFINENPFIKDFGEIYNYIK